MPKRRLLAGTAMTLAIAFPAAAFAAGPEADTPQVAVSPAASNNTPNAPLVDSSQQGVLVFTPDFFADQRPNTALEMVQRVPGFIVDNGSGSRGFEGSVGNILINNTRPASKTDNGSNVLGRTQAVDVERIELIRGGAPGIDMQGYAVVVNVVLKSSASRQQILQVNSALYEGKGRDLFGFSYQYTVREGDRSWGVTLSDSISMSDGNGSGFLVRRSPDGTVIRRENVFNDNYGGGTSLRGVYAGPFAGGKIDLTARYGVSDWQGYNLARSATMVRDSRHQEDNTNGEIGGTWERALSTRNTLEARLMHQFGSWDGGSSYVVHENNIAGPAQIFNQTGDWSESIARALVRHERSARVTFEGGAEAAYNMRETEQSYTVGGETVVLPSASVKVEETRGELFAKSTWRIRPDLTLEAGLRLEASTISQSGDANQEKSFFFAKPRFMASWTPKENNQLRFRFERVLGQLDFADFAASAELGNENIYGGNVDLEPEQRWTSELTYERRFWDRGVLTVGYRHDEIIDVIDLIPLPRRMSATGNIGDGTLDRLSVNMVLPMDRFGFSGGQLSFRNNWDRTSVTDPTTGEDRRISNVRHSQPTISVQQDIDSWKLQWGLSFMPSLREVSYNPDETYGWGGSNYWDGFVEYKPTKDLTFRASLVVWESLYQDRVVFSERSPRTIDFTETGKRDPRVVAQFRIRQAF